MMAIYGGMWDLKRTSNHLGWGNPQSDDSYLEGFAEFVSLLETQYYKDSYPKLSNPSVYYWDGTASNLEKNFNIKDDEEFAIASIMWDLYDPASNSQIDKDHIQIDRTTLWGVMSTQHTFSDGKTRYIHGTRDLYEAVKSLNDPQFTKKYTDAYEPRDDGWMDETTALDKIFIAHGAYWDKNNNSKWDPDEEVGYTAKKGAPATMRSDKELPPGSYISANINNGAVQSGTVKVKVTHPDEYSYLDYEYESEFSDGLIGIDPPYDVPTTWEMSVSSGGSSESEPVTLTSEDYNGNYDPSSQYFGSASFTVTGAGTDTGYDSGYGTDTGYDGSSDGGYQYPTDGYNGGQPYDETAACCPAFALLLGLGGFIAGRAYITRD
jgi:hypothetical protein